MNRFAIDEMVIILHRSSGLRFDEGLAFLRHRYRGARRPTAFRAGMALDSGTPIQTLAARCGWRDLSASA